MITHCGNAKNGPHSGAEALGYELFDSIIHSHNVAQITVLVGLLQIA